MEQNPASKTVKGLSIAIIVLSIIGIVASLIGFAFSAAITGALAGNRDQIVTEISASSGTATDQTDMLKCLLKNLNKDQASNLGELMATAKQSHISNLGEAIVEQDFDEIDDALYDLRDDSVSKISDADIDELAEALANLKTEDALTVGNAFYSMNGIDFALVSSDLINGQVSGGAVDAVKTITTNGGSVADLTIFIASFLSIILGLCLVYSIITLVAGILGLRNCENSEKLKGAFVWNIIGAVFSGLSGSIIMLILMIINAVYINKVRKGVQQPVVQQEPPAAPVA